MEKIVLLKNKLLIIVFCARISRFNVIAIIITAMSLLTGLIFAPLLFANVCQFTRTWHYIIVIAPSYLSVVREICKLGPHTRHINSNLNEDTCYALQRSQSSSRGEIYIVKRKILGPRTPKIAYRAMSVQLKAGRNPKH